MIGALLLFFVIADPPIPQAAFTARVYLPGKARSYHDVYLWRGPEMGPERLYRSSKDCHGVHWLDRNRLQWVELEGYWSASRTMYTVQLDLSTFRVFVLQKEMMEPSHYRSATRTEPRVRAPSGFAFGPKTPEPEYIGVEPTGVKVPNDENPSHISILEFESKRLSAGMSFHGFAQFVPGRSESEFFLYDGSFASSAGSWAGVWRLDYDAMQVEHIIDGPTTIEFHPSYLYWSGVTGRKWLVEFDGMRLWQEKGFVGNWQTGDVWNVMEKPSSVSSIALRPPRP